MTLYTISSVQSLSCDPRDCSTSGASPTLGACSNSCPLTQWCHPIISFSVIPVFSRPQFFPASESFPMSWLFISGGQIIGASPSASILPMNIQGWFPLGLTGLISLLSKRLSRVFPSTTIWKHQFFSSKSSWWFNFHYSVSNYFQMYNTLSLAYSNYKYLSEHKCLDNKDQCKTKPWNLIGIGLGKAVRQRNKLR